MQIQHQVFFLNMALSCCHYHLYSVDPEKGEFQRGIRFNTGQRLFFQTDNDAALPTHPVAVNWGLMSWRQGV